LYHSFRSFVFCFIPFFKFLQAADETGNCPAGQLRKVRAGLLKKNHQNNQHLKKKDYFQSLFQTA
jgi:hypothetical protein